MSNNNVHKIDGADLRPRVEERHRENWRIANLSGSVEEQLLLLHELQVHQIELEIQNAELLQARSEMEVELGKYTDLYDFAPVGYLTLDRNGIIRAANLAGSGLIGIERSKLICQRFGFFISNKTRSTFDDFLEKVFTNPAKESCEVALLKEGNFELIIELKGVASASREECSIALIDITERKRAVNDLRASEDQFRAIFELSSIGKAIVNPLTGRFLLVNDHFCEITGYSRDEMLKKTSLDITHPEDRARDNEVVEKGKCQEPQSWLIEKRYIRKDFSVVWVEVSGTMLYGLDGHLKNPIAAISDITERKQVEETLKKFNEDLESRVKERTAELRDKDQMLLIQSRQAAMGEMIGNIAHQWRQPLNHLGIIVQELPLLSDSGELTKENLHNSVMHSMNLIQHMSKTIEDFRNYFRPDKEMIEFKVSVAIENTLSLIKDSFISKQIQIEVIAKNDPVINGYPNEYAQVLLNILNNARDALIEKEIDDCSRITINIFTEADRSVVTISDNAGGIPEEIINKIFDPYFTTKELQLGTGIGLFMSKAIIEKNMGGWLTACNIANGAEFRIEV